MVLLILSKPILAFWQPQLPSKQWISVVHIILRKLLLSAQILSRQLQEEKTGFCFTWLIFQVFANGDSLVVVVYGDEVCVLAVLLTLELCRVVRLLQAGMIEQKITHSHFQKTPLKMCARCIFCHLNELSRGPIQSFPIAFLLSFHVLDAKVDNWEVDLPWHANNFSLNPS